MPRRSHTEPPTEKALSASLDGPSRTIIVEPVTEPTPPKTLEPAPERQPDPPRVPAR